MTSYLSIHPSVRSYVIGTFKLTITTFITTFEMKTVRSIEYNRSSCASDQNRNHFTHTHISSASERERTQHIHVLFCRDYLFGVNLFLLLIATCTHIGKILKIAYPLFGLISIEIFSFRFSFGWIQNVRGFHIWRDSFAFSAFVGKNFAFCITKPKKKSTTTSTNEERFYSCKEITRLLYGSTTSHVPKLKIDLNA